MNYQANANFASEMDGGDPLAGYREQFYIPQHHGQDEIYLCGNSLGLQPKSTARYIREELEDWQRLAVKAHFAGRRPWMPYHALATAGIARIVGARPEEVVSMNALTVNLHLMLVSFYRPTATRCKVLIERGAFPSDRYAVESQIRFHELAPHTCLMELAPRAGRASLETEEIEAAIQAAGESLALVLLPGVQYYSGQAFDLARIADAAHAVGAFAGFDLAHAAGNLPLRLHEWNTDFAVWCNYKYLNAGPGAVGGCFVHARHLGDHRLPRFAGWWGDDPKTRFKMQPDFMPTPSAESWQLSNPPILALAPLLASLEIFDSVGMERLRKKSRELTGYLQYLLDEKLADTVEVVTPRAAEARGCQLSLRLRGPAAAAHRAFDALDAHGVTADWREPDVIRVAPVPLYNSFSDVYRFVEILGRVLHGEL